MSWYGDGTVGGRIVYPTMGVDWLETPQTIAFWILPDVFQSSTRFIGDRTSGGSANSGVHVRYGSTSGNVYVLTYRNVGAWPYRRTSGALSLGVWNHLIVTWDAGTLASGIHIYFNGVEQSYNASADGSGSSGPGDGETWLLNHTTSGGSAKVHLAELGRWTRVLSSTELAMLAAGYAPSYFMNGLARYMPLIRSTHDIASGTSGSDISVLNSDSPPVHRPSAMILPFPKTVAGGASKILTHPGMSGYMQELRGGIRG